MRTRFAPSPTGFLHVGGLRTALYACALAKQNGGQFLLRIEDTDQERNVPGAIEQIIHSLQWAGLAPTEGVVLQDGQVAQAGAKGPYIQSERLEIYRKHADLLHERGYAYPCFCTKDRLEAMRKQQEAAHQAPMYDRHCLQLSTEEIDKKLAAGEPHVLRLKIPRDEVISFEDDIRGLVTFRGDTIDDQVLLKSDGFPTYHLAHVVDDHLMEIDVVLRGEEWLSSLPKHLLLFQYFGWTPPRYAHVSLLLNKDKSKLSKRQNSVSVDEYRNKGYLPEALINFLALLGWNPGTTQEIFTLEELIQQFSLDRAQKAGAIFDLEKLDWLQGQWMRKLPLQDFADRIREDVGEQYSAALTDPKFLERVALIQERIIFFHEAPDMLSYFYQEPAVNMDVILSAKQKVTTDILATILDLLTKTLEGMADANWTADGIKNALEQALTDSGFKRGQLLWVLRAAVTGRDYSPGAYEVAASVGKEETVKRLQNVNALIKS